MSIFVFGSNREGRHGAGAAKAALKFHGAVYGQAEGRQGNSYAIVTKELRKDQPPVTLEEVQRGVWVFLKYAADHPEVIFQVTPIGTGLAGFKPSEIAPMFKGASSNVLLPLGGMFMCLFVGWVWGFDKVKRALSNDGKLNNSRAITVFFTLVKYVTPLLVLLVLLDGLNII